MYNVCRPHVIIGFVFVAIVEIISSSWASKNNAVSVCVMGLMFFFYFVFLTLVHDCHHIGKSTVISGLMMLRRISKR